MRDAGAGGGAAAPFHSTDPEEIAERVLSRVGREVVLGLPLGLGKANHVANALYRRAAADPSIDLRIFTALTLSPPTPGSDLERRFMEPVLERAFGGYPELAWVEPVREDALPANIEVNEFFFQAGAWTGSRAAQRSYISANYTHASRYILQRGVNVVAQLVGEERRAHGPLYNLSCNTDITLELLEARRSGKADFMLIGQVNRELPFMPGAAEAEPTLFDMILDGHDFPLPGPPKQPVTLADHARGLHIASLIPDGGTLEIGIGALGDAVCHALILRHTNPTAFRDILRRITPPGERIERHTGSFTEGLYACTEMFVDGFLELWRAGVLKREVEGAVLHAAFFLGPKDFYAALRKLPEEERARFAMTSVGFVNDLYGPDMAERMAARRRARFVNNAMIATLTGAIVSDGLEDGRVVSGVGGQYNFVAQAFALEGARSIITLPAVRSGPPAQSNIRAGYGHVTIPRHLRDIVVTEYGVADLLGVADHAVAERMIAIADARFQPRLLADAKRMGKIAENYSLPRAGCNSPSAIAEALGSARKEGLLPLFPFGSDFSEAELHLMPTLKSLRGASKPELARLMLAGLRAGEPSGRDRQALERMGLSNPAGLKERIFALLVKGALG